MNLIARLTASALVATAATMTPAFADPAPETNTRLLDPANEKPGLKVGEKAPAVTLIDVNGDEVDLATLYAEKAPVVVTFYRGGWCPFCNKALKAWGDKIDELESAGATFIAITPESPEQTVAAREKIGWSYAALVDRDGSAMRAFKVGFEAPSQYEPMLKARNASGRNELPAPATFIIDKDGVVRWAFNDWDYKKRADPDEVIAEVRKLTGRSG